MGLLLIILRIPSKGTENSCHHLDASDNDSTAAGRHDASRLEPHHAKSSELCRRQNCRLFALSAAASATDDGHDGAPVAPAAPVIVANVDHPRARASFGSERVDDVDECQP